MSESIFWVITYVIFGFSFLPLILSLLLRRFKLEIDNNILLIAVTEFATSFSNLAFYLLGYGACTWQYDMYSTAEVFCFLLVFYRLNLKSVTNKIISLIIFLLFLIPLILVYFSIETRFYSKFLQFLLSLYLIRNYFQNSYLKEIKSSYLALSIGLLIYSVISFNLFIFIDWFPKFSKENYYLIWILHQFSALVFYVLISVGLWMGRRKSLII